MENNTKDAEKMKNEEGGMCVLFLEVSKRCKTSRSSTLTYRPSFFIFLASLLLFSITEHSSEL
jgi:hypothetical protein